MSDQAIPTWFSDISWAGKVRTIPYKPLDDRELPLFDRDFSSMVEQLRKHDPEIAANYDAQRAYYKIAAGIFKGTFDLPFGGQETSSGEFAFVGPLLPAYPFLAARNWVVSVSAGWNNLFGSSGTGIAGSSTVGTRRMYAYQALLSVAGDPKLMALLFNINGYAYPGQDMLTQDKVPKKETWVRYFDFAKNVLIHPTGTHYLRAAFEQAGQVELIPLGLMFAEHDYIKTEANWYT